MDGECLSLVIESGKHGDRYYRAMKNLLLTRYKGRSKDECYQLALIYQDSLQTLLDSLRQLTPSKHVQERIDRTIEFQDLLLKDIAILTSH